MNPKQNEKRSHPRHKPFEIHITIPIGKSKRMSRGGNEERMKRRKLEKQEQCRKKRQQNKQTIKSKKQTSDNS